MRFKEINRDEYDDEFKFYSDLTVQRLQAEKEHKEEKEKYFTYIDNETNTTALLQIICKELFNIKGKLS